MGQEPLAPPSVKGWDGGPAWINTNTLLARFNFVNALIATNRRVGGTMSAPADAAPNIAPDAIVARAGGLEPSRIIEAIVTDALQNDVTGDIRATLRAFLDSTGDIPSAGGQVNPMPFGPENYQEKIRGALALTLNLPVNQLN
jgi:hypothetical protein